MSINRNNYEAFFLDYRENNLTPEQIAELLVFLEQNPNLKEEFGSFENIKLKPEHKIRFELKESLKKRELIPTENIDSSNYEEFIVADLEGDLSENGRLELKAFTELNPKTRLDYNIFRSTFLKPEKAILFREKEHLKKAGLFVFYRTQLVYGLAIAASVIILLGVYFSFLEKPSKLVFTDSIRKITTKPLASGESLFKTERKIQLLPEIKSRQSEQNVAFHDFGEQDVTKTEEFARMEIRQVNSISHLRPALIHPLNPIFNDPQFSAISEMDLAANDDVKTQKSFLSRFISGLAGKVIKTDNLRGKSFLDYTIDGYNLMADKDVSLEKEMDETGKVIAYTLNGEEISFSRSKNNAKE